MPEQPTQYALLYERMSVATKRMEMVVAHYTSDDRDFGPFEYIDLPRKEAAAKMVAEGLTDLGTSGPQSILLRKDNNTQEDNDENR